MNKEAWKQNNLRKIRKERGLTLIQVAEKMNMQCADRISHWEKGSAMPSVLNLVKLAKIYDIDIAKLLT